MAIDNNPAIRPPKAGDLDEEGQVVASTPLIDPVSAPRTIGETAPTAPANGGSTPLIDPRMPLDPVVLDSPPITGDPQGPSAPTGDPPPIAPPGTPPTAPPIAGTTDPANPFNLPELAPPPITGSEMDANTPPGGAGGIGTTELQDYASQGLQNPSRYDIDLVQQGVDLINQNLEREQTYGQADLDELMSSRGLVGSNVEADAHANLLGRLAQSRQQQSFDLARDMAATQAQDRTAAGSMAVQAGQFSEQIAQRFQQESQFARSLASRDAQTAMNYGLEQRAQQLQATGMSLDEAFRRASMEMEGGLRTRALDLQQQGLDEETAYRYAALDQDSRLRDRSMDLQEQGMDLEDAYRYAALGQDAEFRERAQQLQAEGMELDEAYRQSELELRERQIEQDRKMDVLSIILSSISGIEDDELADIMSGLFGESGATPNRPEWFRGTDEQWQEANDSGDIWQWMEDNRDNV